MMEGTEEVNCKPGEHNTPKSKQEQLNMLDIPTKTLLEMMWWLTSDLPSTFSDKETEEIEKMPQRTYLRDLKGRAAGVITNETP